MKIKINDIFYSVQGEGARAGTPNIFIRLSGCNLTCYFCDTNHSFIKEELTKEALALKLKKYPCKNIIWTGGEPTLQLNEEIAYYFKKLGYYQAIETNGINEVAQSIDYISCSPKTKDIVLKYANEIRLCIKAGDIIPDINNLIKAENYYLSPMTDVYLQQHIKENINYCINHILLIENKYILSTQQHKQWNIK